MADPTLVTEFQNFSKKTVEVQQQYITLVNQILPSKEIETRSLNRVKYELEALPEDNIIYHSVGKMFLSSNMHLTHKMIDSSMESNKRAMLILTEKKAALEKALIEAEEKHKFYLLKLNSA